MSEIRFACPGCQAEYKSKVEHAGATIACAKCQQSFQIPKPAPVAEVPIARLIAEPAPVAVDGLTVRCMSQGLESRRFKSRVSEPELLAELQDGLFSMGLRQRNEWTWEGVPRGTDTSFCKTDATCSIRTSPERGEVIVDFAWHHRMPVMAIVLAVILFPIGLAISFYF